MEKKGHSLFYCYKLKHILGRCSGISKSTNSNRYTDGTYMQERVIKHNGSREKLPRNFYDIGKIRKVRKGISNTFGKCTVSLKCFKSE